LLPTLSLRLHSLHSLHGLHRLYPLHPLHALQARHTCQTRRHAACAPTGPRVLLLLLNHLLEMLGRHAEVVG
jgi:hypothetical protein